MWVGDVAVAEHEGGYTPFEADLTHLVAPGQELRITVVVNNELTWESIPPGIVEVTDDGSRRQRYYHDFFNYAGLHRSVWLHSTPRSHIADVTVVTAIDGGIGLVRCSTVVEAEPGASVRLHLRDAVGEIVAEAVGPDTELRVPEPKRWQPGPRISLRARGRAGRRRSARRPLHARRSASGPSASTGTAS